MCLVDYLPLSSIFLLKYSVLGKCDDLTKSDTALSSFSVIYVCSRKRLCGVLRTFFQVGTLSLNFNIKNVPYLFSRWACLTNNFKFGSKN